MPIEHPDLAVNFAPDEKVTRYLLTGGYVIDCRSSHPGSSDERDHVLAQAAKHFGKDPDRSIVGEAALDDQPALPIDKTTGGKK